MSIFPGNSAVLVAERQLERSKQQLRQRLERSRSALTSPMGLLVVSGIGALLGLLLARRKTRIVLSTFVSAASPLRSLFLTLLIRFIAQRITRKADA